MGFGGGGGGGVGGGVMERGGKGKGGGGVEHIGDVERVQGSGSTLNNAPSAQVLYTVCGFSM